MIVYYAHCMDIYHTQQEAADVHTLQKLGFVVINPSDKGYDKAWEEKGMDYADTLVQNSDALAFRRTLHGKIPSGVYYEIDKALELGLPVFELPGFLFGDVMSYEQTKKYLTDNPSEYYKKRMAKKN